MAGSVLAVVRAVTEYQSWLTSIYVLLLTGVVTLLSSLAWRPSFPKAAPKMLREGYPILGALRLFSKPANFYHDGVHGSKTGNFSFYFGKNQVVGLSGSEGRKAFFESKAMNLWAGYSVFLTSQPKVDDSMGPSDNEDFMKWVLRNLSAVTRTEIFVKNLPRFVSDARKQFEDLVAVSGPSGTFDPFDVIYRTVYQLTMRTFGANEIAESPELLAKTLSLFQQIEKSSSPARIIFPWLPTAAHLRRMAIGARLYMIVNRIVDERRSTGRREDDALQYLLDNGNSIVRILGFVAGANFAGQINSGVNSSAMMVYLACNPEWYSRVQSEIDDVVAARRLFPDDTPADVLGRLTIEDWESCFPNIDLCLRETIRIQLVGPAFRKNISDKPVPIGDTGEVVPVGAYAAYIMDEIHMDPQVYTDPTRWDPGRFLPDRAEDKRAPLGYVGWGIGRHPCPGMRFTKLEMRVIGALFVSMFDYELVDAQGNKTVEVPVPNRNRLSVGKPDVSQRLRYKLRKH